MFIGSGFIGSDIIKPFNERGVSDILVIDDVTDQTKLASLVKL